MSPPIANAMNDAATVTPAQLATLLSYAIKAHEPVLVTSAPGVGKSAISYQASIKAEADFMVAHPVVDSPIDYKGIPFVFQNGTADFIPYGFLKAMMEAKKLTVVLLDDLGQAPPAVQAACMQLLLERAINGHRISDNIVFIACTNRKQDKAGVSGILEPVKSRFCTIVELVPDLNSFIKWYLSTDLPITPASFARFRPDYLHDFKATSDMTNSPCPRTLEKLARLVQMNLPSDLRFAAYSGAVGKACATEYLAFEEMADKMVDPSVIIMRPADSQVPTSPDGLYATCLGVAAQAHEDNIDAIDIYGRRLPADFRAMLMDDIIRKDESLVRTKVFQKFFSENHAKHLV